MGEFYQNGEKKYSWGVNDSMHPQFHQNGAINRPLQSQAAHPTAPMTNGPIYSPNNFGTGPTYGGQRGAHVSGRAVLLALVSPFLLGAVALLTLMGWTYASPYVNDAELFQTHCGMYWGDRSTALHQGFVLPPVNGTAMWCPQAGLDRVREAVWTMRHGTGTHPISELDRSVTGPSLEKSGRARGRHHRHRSLRHEIASASEGRD